jgi:hypothetical protein
MLWLKPLLKMAVAIINVAGKTNITLNLNFECVDILDLWNIIQIFYTYFYTIDLILRFVLVCQSKEKSFLNTVSCHLLMP